jgi:hypothetical protein
MNVVILTPFFYPNINGMTLSCHRHAEILSSENLGCNVFFFYLEKSRFVTYNLGDMPFNSKLRTMSYRNAFNVLKNADVVVLEGWSHFLLLIFCFCVSKKRIFFSHGSHFPSDFKVFSFFKFFLRQLLYLVPNILIFFGRVRFITLSNKPDLKRFRDVLLFNVFRRIYFVVPNFSFEDNVIDFVEDNTNKNIGYNNKFLMVGVGDDNKGQFDIVKYWTDIEGFRELHLYFPAKNRYTDEIDSFLLNKKIENIKVYYGSNREQIWNLLPMYKALIVNSNTECQSLAVIDALVKNRKVISTITGQYLDEYHKHFFYFTRGNFSDFLNALTRSENSEEFEKSINLYNSNFYRNHFKF